MASSQVEFSSSSSPFRCVLRDRNRREPNVTASHVARFRTNLKSLVMDRLNDCISITPPIPIHRRSDRCPAKPLHQTSSSSTPIVDHPSSTTTNDPQTQTPPIPTPTDDNQTSKLGASSLVQIWEKRLNVSGLNVNNTTGKQVVELMNSEQQQVEAAATATATAGDLEDEPGIEDGFADWQSNRTSSSSPPSSSSTQSQSSDAGEKERVRVVDIIRRLTLTTTAAAAKPPHSTTWVEDKDNNNDNESSSSSSSYPIPILKDKVEPTKCLTHILCSPRIRGRQAFADLLLQIQRDRQRELDTLLHRRPVSKFTQRGRIQSLLRLKILKRGMALEDEQQQQQRPQFVITPRENHKSSTIMHLRERFSKVGENGARSSIIGEMMLNNNDDDKTQSDTDATTTTHATNTNNDNNNQQVVDDIHSSIDTVLVLHKHEHDNNPIPVDDVKQQIQLDPPSSNSEATWKEDTPNLNLNSQDSINRWEDSQTAEEDQSCVVMGTSYDWFTDISRPRSYWEDRRQTWYQQMLDSNSASDEIRHLIQRKTVSNFLSSDFRERMDKLMVSRLKGRQTQQQEKYDEVNEEEEEEELWCFSSEGHSQSKSSDNEEEEDERSNARDHEANGYLQMASPSILSSWSYQDNEMGEDSNRGASPQPCPPQFSSNSQRSSVVSTTHNSSIEMELIYDLRGHMEQLYREMSELRKSIKCCMDMQHLMLQRSMKHEVVAGAGGGRKPNKAKKSRKRKCCICYDMEIDSLLYRCGHMCSCMKCAKELQWRGGKCPVCRAPIEDVVRASFTT